MESYNPMAAAAAAATTTASPSNLRRVCFSFAAYAKIVIDNLKASNIPVAQGLTDDEFAAVESAYNFTFPPDLRSILQEGLPVGPGFPNWRSSSPQQLQILTSLPILGLCKQVSRRNFWAQPWGEKPADADESVKLAQRFLKKEAPVLVPIYRHCYIPSAPNLAGNPVLYVHGGDVRLSSYDLAGFFQKIDLGRGLGGDGQDQGRATTLSSILNTPAWAATEARRIEFWTELVEECERRKAAEYGRSRWWWGGVLGRCMEDVWWRLREGGWGEEEVREMMMMDGGGGGDEESDRVKGQRKKKKKVFLNLDLNLRDKEGVVGHVRVLSLRLLRAGWSREDVVDSLGSQIENDVESWLGFQFQNNTNTNNCLPPEAI